MTFVKYFITILFLTSATKTDALTTNVDCQPDWTNIGVQCYRLFTSLSPWESAAKVCKSYGSELATVTDYYETEDVGKFADSKGKTKFWIGLTRVRYDGNNHIGADPGNEQETFWSNGDKTTVFSGFWKNFQPDSSKKQECVYIEKQGVTYKWSFTQCETKLGYLCQRPACPEGSFHCSNTRCINNNLTCDGEDDCGDSSDELDCPSKCSYVIKQDTGRFVSPNYPNNYSDSVNCLWVIEVQTGSNVVLQFHSFVTEQNGDIVEILVGGQIESMSLLVKSLSGNQNGRNLKFVSSNNFLIVKFTSDASVGAAGFNASFSSRKANFPDYKQLTARDAPQEMTSPFYDQGWNYVGSQDYTWIITAEKKTKIITLEVVEVDLKNNDFVLVRDGDSVVDKLLVTFNSDTTNTPYIFSTSNKMYITMQTRSYWTGKGFKFNYFQGCTATLTKDYGNIFSPGYGIANYADNQKCTWNISSGKDLTFLVEEFDTQENIDVLEIYFTAWTPGATRVKLETLSGKVREFSSPFRKNGIFEMTFKTDTANTRKGFSIKYSKDCKNPNFNSKTILKPANANWWYGSKFQVSCKEGYQFTSKEFQDSAVKDRFVSLSVVEMECLYGGEWNTRTVPICEPVFCGKAPPVEYTYIVTSYPKGAQSSVYGGVVSYSCYPGFTMTGSANITCLANGTFESQPTCSVASCPSLPSTVQNGYKNITEGDGTAFGSIVRYFCNAGYHVIGTAILFCETSSSWSAPPPTCNRTTCILPSVKNGFLGNNDIVYYEGKKMVECKPGYEFSPGVTSQTLTCQSNQTFTPSVDSISCKDTDECPGDCKQNCTNTDGSYFCSCRDGYTLNPDNKTCDDINECVVQNGGCSQICKNKDGGYECSCSAGFSLFTDNGTEKYYIPPTETGMLAGDLFYINHTCVRKLCPPVPNINNGYVLSKIQQHRYGDFVQFACNIGYILEGNSPISCTDSGSWSYKSGSEPKCKAATCPVETLPQGLKTPAIVNPASPVNYLSNVTLQCNVPGKTPFERIRRCLYSQPDNQYRLDGAPYECGVIDCGQPPETPGAKIPNLSVTTFNTTFNFECKNLHAVSGQSQDGNTVVRCGDDGYWGFNTLQCLGKTCTDPGRPPDGDQANQTDQYQESSEVYFNCSRPGFSLVGTNPIKCQINNAGSGLNWSAPVPECKDTEKPVFTDCVSTKSVSLYVRASDVVPVPNAKDNVGIKSFSVSPQWPSKEYIITQNVTFIFVAEDFAGNQEICTTNIIIKDEIKPTIQCPAAEIKWMFTDTENIIETFQSSKVNVSDDSGVSPDVTFSPPSFFANQDSVNTVFSVQATATDKAGNQNTCQFEYLIKAAPCSPLSLVTPIHASKTCTARSGNAGYNCTLTCDSGFVFYDQSTTTAAQNSLNVQCDKGKSWTTNIPACVDAVKTTANFYQMFEVHYTSSGTVLDTCKQDYAEVIKNKYETQSVFSTITSACSNIIDATISSVTVAEPDNDIIIDNQNKKIKINYTISFTWSKKSSLTICAGLLKTVLESTGTTQSNVMNSTLDTVTGCPAINVVHQLNDDNDIAVALEVSKEYVCPTNMKKTVYNNLQMCLECSEGTYNSGSNTCVLCPVGMYQQSTGQQFCLNCDPGTSTYMAGSTLKSQCSATCPRGSYSENQLQPCARCPLNTYWFNTTYCKPCPADSITRHTGATSISMCQAKCPEGKYSRNDGHEPCLLCPRDFYQETTGQKSCTRCLDNAITATTGSTSPDNCMVGVASICSTNACSGQGTCIVKHQSAVCTCNPGYTGEKCENVINQCDSGPCFNGGTCVQNATSYYCQCKQGTQVDNCEVDIDECSSNPCENGGMCQNQINGYKCHCFAGYGGVNCSTVEPVCTTHPCKNGATCVPLGNIRRKCQCQAGYTAEDCSQEIDDCESNPCYYGGTCKDKHLGFECTCPSGYTGQRCENPPQQCLDVQCGPGQCVADHIHNTYQCVCNAGMLYGKFCQYDIMVKKQMTSSSVTKSYSNKTAKECLNICEGKDDCKAFTFNTTSNDCELHGQATTNLTDSESTNYYIKTCKDQSDDFWTPWYNTKKPTTDTNSKDEENNDTLLEVGIAICKGTDPVNVECRDVTNKLPPNEIITCSVATGLTCSNKEQTDKQCENYEIRFKCAVSRVFTENTCTQPAYCQSSPCQHGTCQEKVDGFSCSCYTGYQGYLCQHDIDYCASKPCLNGGTCEDRLSDYICKCADGFTGTNCEINIDDCKPNPCKNSGKCQDGINGYECDCPKGWTGQNCETDVDECSLGEPCLHGGQCKNVPGTYTCQCPDGWKNPKSCNDIVKLCNPATCNNNAKCFNLFNDFFCKCKANTYGKKCESNPSICANANPCQHMNYCNETAGTAICYCTEDFEGDGCELRVDHCKSNTCKNGATCTQTATNDCTCACTPGYDGKNCENNVDNCAGVSCPGGSCIDGVNEYFCRCPVGKTGETCSKDVNRNYDLLFELPQKTNMASLPYPIPLKVTQLTISFWVRFWEKDGKGTFFSMFSVAKPNSLSGKKELLHVDEKGLYIDFNGSNTFFDFPYYKYNDGRWNNIIINWDSTTGKLNFIVNSINRSPIKSYAKDVTLDENVWLVLGSKYDPATEKPVTNEGFNGWISQLVIYNRVLDFSTEVQQSLDFPTKLFKDYIFVWNEFVRSAGVKMIIPSTVKKPYESCPRGFSGAPACKQADPQKIMVLPTFCPSDVKKLGTSRITYVTWNEPKFVGEASVVKKSYSSGDAFLWGKYLVVYVAENSAGNKGLCSFKVFVQYRNCPKPPDPYQGIASYGNSQQKYYYTSIICNDNKAVVRPVPNIYTCGHFGSWNPPKKFLHFRLPPCGAKKMKSFQTVKIKLVYIVGTSNCEGVKSILEQEIRTKILQLNNKWPNLCPKTNCDDVVVSIKCGTNLITRRRKRASNDVIAYITLPQANVNVTSTSGETLPATDVLKRSIFADNDFDFSNLISNGIPLSHEVVISADLACPSGQALVQQECVECAPGTFYNSVTKTCDDCPVGQYQTSAGQTSCTSCDSGKTTELPGSNTKTNCKASCTPGEYFDYTSDKCEKCDYGFYQSSPGQFYCEPCVVENTTRAQGSTRESDCYMSCPPGKEYEGGACVPCKKGFYKEVSMATKCTQCPPNKTTAEEGSTQASDCNLDIKSDALSEEIIFIIIGSVSGIVVTSFLVIGIILLLRRQGCLISKIDKKQDETYSHLDDRRREEVSSETHNEAAYDNLELYEVANEINLNNSDQESRQSGQPESDTLTEPDHSYDSLQERRERPYATLQPYENLEN